MEAKKTYSTVKPTCGENNCLKNKKIKFRRLVPRKSTRKFQYENKLKRKIRTIEAQERRNVQRKRQKLFHEYQ